jgi:hypothetical protein
MELSEEIKIQKNTKLRKRVFKVIQSMYGLFGGSAVDIQIVDKYMNVMKPLSNGIQDVVLFPYESKKGSLAEKKIAKHCLFALMTNMIKTWHGHCGGNDNCISALEPLLDKIEFIIKNKLTLPVRGNDDTGYYFKMPKG